MADSSDGYFSEDDFSDDYSDYDDDIPELEPVKVLSDFEVFELEWNTFYTIDMLTGKICFLSTIQLYLLKLY